MSCAGEVTATFYCRVSVMGGSYDATTQGKLCRSSTNVPIAGKRGPDTHVHGPELRTRGRYLQGLCVGVSDTVISRSEYGAGVSVLIGNHGRQDTAYYWVSGHEPATNSNKFIDSIGLHLENWTSLHIYSCFEPDSAHDGGTCGPTLGDPISFCKTSRPTGTEVTSAIIERLPSYMASYGTRTADTMCGVSGLGEVPQGLGGGAVLGYRDSRVKYPYKHVDNITGFPVNAAGSRTMGNLEPAQTQPQIIWSGGITGFTNIATRLLQSTIWRVLGYMMHAIIVSPRHSSASMLMGEEQLPSSELSTDEWDCMGIFSSADTRTVIEADVTEQISPLNHTLRHINVASGERELFIVSGGGNFGHPARGADETEFLPWASSLGHGHLIGTRHVLNKGT